MTHCAWLGSRDDPRTHFAYPIEENVCGAPNGPRSLDLAYQTRWCLADDHSACSFFVAPDSIAALGSPESIQTNARRRCNRQGLFLAVGGILVLALFVAFIVLGPFRTNEANSTARETVSLIIPPSVIPAPSIPIVVLATPVPSVTTTPVPIDTPSPIPLTYTVQAGDTLAKIASQFGVNAATIADANNIKDPTKIRTGTVLVIPGKSVPTKTPGR